MNREEAIELFVATVRDGNPGCFACKKRNDRDKCARCVITSLLKDLPFLALVDREAKLEEYKNVTEDKYDWEGNWTETIKVQVPKTFEDFIKEGWVKEIK